MWSHREKYFLPVALQRVAELRPAVECLSEDVHLGAARPEDGYREGDNRVDGSPEEADDSPGADSKGADGNPAEEDNTDTGRGPTPHNRLHRHKLLHSASRSCWQ